jgi:glycosyltransferase involved in cell wall biosynthesis
MNASVLILTRNEEQNLPHCLSAVSWSDDIVVFDSHSTDRTVEIARAAGARVFQRRFDNERDHRTASLRLPFRHPWVFNPDADELTTPELSREILDVVRCPSRGEAAFRVRFKNIFMGRWVRRSSLYPTWIVRLFRPEALSFERVVNLRYVVHGQEGRLRHHLVHQSFQKGFHAWFAKHNDYSSKEAMEAFAADLRWRDLMGADPVARRRALKELSFHLPCRPTLRFLYSYVLRGGFLEGRAGLEYCKLLGIYEYMIALKMREARVCGAGCQPAADWQSARRLSTSCERF